MGGGEPLPPAPLQPPQPGPCLRMTTSSSRSPLQASAALRATSYRQPAPLFPSPAMLLHSDPHPWVLTSSLSSVNTRAQYFHSTEAFSLYQSHKTASRVQYARAHSACPHTELNVAGWPWVGAALPSRLPSVHTGRASSAPGRPSAPDALSKALPCLFIGVVCLPCWRTGVTPSQSEVGSVRRARTTPRLSHVIRRGICSIHTVSEDKAHASGTGRAFLSEPHTVPCRPPTIPTSVLRY